MTAVVAPRLAEERAADVAVTCLLTCFLREAGPSAVATGDRLRIRLENLGVDLEVGLRHRSATGHHLLDPPVQVVAAPQAPSVALGPASLAALLARELAADDPRADPEGLIAAVTESHRNLTRFLARGAAPSDGLTPFLRAEQSLLRGHPLHPTPKSREPMTPAEVEEFSPELGAAFALHWISAESGLVLEDSALDRTATEVLAGLVADDDRAEPELRRLAGRGSGRALLPLHPWQARRLLARPDVAGLLDAGRLRDHGLQGAPWSPTSSVRTVGRPGDAVMLKLSLGVRITNSVRVNLRKELARGVEVHRLLEAGLGAELAERFPRFGILRDPAWATLAGPAPGTESGFEVVIRENPYGDCDDAAAVAALCEPSPDGGPPPLAVHVHALAAAERCTVPAAARRWFELYLEVAIDPILWLYGAEGIALEAHQQNGVVLLHNGLPAGFRYRDNQGYYFKRSHEDRLRWLLPGLNAQSDTVCDDAVADERLGYYLGINHVLGLVGCMGRAGLADETDLLIDLARHLAAPERAFPGSPLVDTLLGSPTLRCKANLRTRLDGMDELVGPMASQSIYVDIPNPLRAPVTAGAWG
ncbi:MAG TPA: IucA/IucC family protein [Candidatus Dormibacteraeota bacterium]|nr:IucA/IucC family protein [Candidatus Dormibacteraeota bacterium]